MIRETSINKNIKIKLIYSLKNRQKINYKRKLIECFVFTESSIHKLKIRKHKYNIKK